MPAAAAKRLRLLFAIAHSSVLASLEFSGWVHEIQSNIYYIFQKTCSSSSSTIRDAMENNGWKIYIPLSSDPINEIMCSSHAQAMGK